VLAGVAHHITQRGNRQQGVFLNDDDRLAYLALLKTAAKRYGLDVLGYCLMTNHVHLVVIPSVASSLGRGIGWAHLRYTQMFNARTGENGHLWQNRFFSCALDEEYLWRAMRYVERNPVRAGIVPQAWEYPWSSAAAHSGARDPSGLLDIAAWAARSDAAEWREYLGHADEAEDLQAVRIHTQGGTPLGCREGWGTVTYVPGGHG